MAAHEHLGDKRPSPLEEFGNQGLEAPLDDVRALVPVELLARMFAEVDGFAAGEHQADDMTALTLRLA